MLHRLAVKRELQITLIEARKIEQSLVKQAAERKRQRPSLAIVNPGNPQQAYFAHYENIRSPLTTEDFSRVDAMIALQMRANGHSPQAVIEAIKDCAPAIREGSAKRRNWSAYAERTMNYAFGYAGDRDLQRNTSYIEFWRNIEAQPAVVRARIGTHL